MSEADVDILQDYFEEGTFYLQPTGDPDTTITVNWVGDDFNPVYIAPDQYRLTFELEEVG